MGFLREYTLLQVKINFRSPYTLDSDDAYVVVLDGDVQVYGSVHWDSCGRKSYFALRTSTAKMVRIMCTDMAASAAPMRIGIPAVEILSGRLR